MCQCIRLPEKDIETVQDFVDHYKVDPGKYKYEYHKTIELTACLCQIDLDKFFADHPQYNMVFDGDWWPNEN